MCMDISASTAIYLFIRPVPRPCDGENNTFGSHRWRLIRRHEQIVRGNQLDVKSAKKAAPRSTLLPNPPHLCLHLRVKDLQVAPKARDHHRRFPDVVHASASTSPFHINHLSHALVIVPLSPRRRRPHQQLGQCWDMVRIWVYGLLGTSQTIQIQPHINHSRPGLRLVLPRYTTRRRQ